MSGTTPSSATGLQPTWPVATQAQPLQTPARPFSWGPTGPRRTLGMQLWAVGAHWTELLQSHELVRRLGVVLCSLYEWEQAAGAFRQGLVLEPHNKDLVRPAARWPIQTQALP